MSGTHQNNNGSGTRPPAHGRHARRVSYRGSDDYIVSEVGAPDTERFESEADLSGFDRMVIGHVSDEIKVETVGVADPFAAAPQENYTRPFTTAFDTGEMYGVSETQGYSAFGSLSFEHEYGTPHDGRTESQAPLKVETVGARASQAPAVDDSYYGRGPGGTAGGGDGSDGEPEGEPKKRRRGLKIALIIIAVLVAAIAGGIFWYMHTLDSTLAATEGDAASSTYKPVSMNEPFYVLVMGVDARDVSSDMPPEEWSSLRTDVMILVRVDPKEKIVTMITIPRDTMYEWDDGTVTKINECYGRGGPDAVKKAVSEITGEEISYYVVVNIAQMEEIVDAVGGVEVYVDVPMEYEDAITHEKVSIEPGWHTLNGQEAQIFSRVRKVYEDNQDQHRQSNVRTLALAVLSKVMERSLFEIPGTVLELAKYIVTDMRSGDLLGLATAFGGGSGSYTVYSGTGPYDGDINDEYGGYWYCYPDPEGWANLMAIVDAGGDPSTVDYGY